DEDATEGPLHANFKLSTSGETLKLSDASNLLVDEVTFGTQQPNVGYARVPNGIGSFVLQQPTFNSNNNSLSVVSTTQETFLKIYPNPADEQLTISFDEQLIDKEWKIYTPQGQIILLQNAKAIQTLDVSGWASGIYFFNCGTFTKKIVVK
ncbi:T9SS type A sorting domain-containing protein, partial [Microcystis aeruginosa]|uniref:T9SS type A sorting domain-containing protein n=1 Tax=Microcystis aeruginosa TaxID=1126 RepID=UPI000AA694B7